MVSYSDFEALIIVVVVSVIGIIMSMLLKTLYDAGLITLETGLTITELQTIIIVFFIVIGVVAAAVKR